MHGGKSILLAGDVVHLRFDKQFKDHFHLDRVTKLLLDKVGLFRTVKVALKDNKTGP